MDLKKFGYSLKTILLPDQKTYMKDMMEMVEKFIKRVRWKAYFFENHGNDENEGTDTNFGFKTDETSPQNENLDASEDDLYNLGEKYRV